MTRCPRCLSERHAVGPGQEILNQPGNLLASWSFIYVPKARVARRAKIHLDRVCAALTGKPHQARGRVDVAGRADCDEDVAASDPVLHPPSMVGRFAEQYDVWPQSAVITDGTILSDEKVPFAWEPRPAAHA